MSDELVGVSKAAALHGIAINGAFSPADRLQAAVQALDIYEQEYDTLVAERDRLRRDRDNLTIMFNDEVGWRNAESSRAEVLRAQLMQVERVVEAARAWRTGHAVIEDHGPLDDHEQILAAAVDALDSMTRPDKEN
jgi:hypothetical protein